MPNAQLPSPRQRVVDAEYSYRRPLSLRELVPAVGIGIGAGLFAFYITRLLLQRTPITLDRRPRTRVRARVAGSSPGK